MNDVEREAELRRLLVEVPSLRLRPDDWERIGELATAIEAGGLDRVEDLSQLVFEARVRRRFQGTRSGADVVPTKQTSMLPWVGLVCASLLVAVGALLGGGVILVGVVALGVFVLGIAVAGSRVAHRGRDAGTGADERPPVAIPAGVADRLDALRRP